MGEMRAERCLNLTFSSSESGKRLDRVRCGEDVRQGVQRGLGREPKL